MRSLNSAARFSADLNADFFPRKNAKFKILFIVSKNFWCQTVEKCYQKMPNSNKILMPNVFESATFLESGIENASWQHCHFLSHLE